jgi:phage tail protein X
MTRPAIFISAVTAEYKTTRQRIANVLTRLGYQPVWQDIFGTEPGDLRQMLRDKIDGCEGLIHIVGEAYGAEPPTADPDLGRVSYTQFEFLYACQRGKKTWLFFLSGTCTRDQPLDQLDLPAAPAAPDAGSYQAERRQLQNDYRDKLRQSGHLWHEPTSETDLDYKIERLRDELATLRRGFQRWQRRVLGGVVLALVMLCCVLGGLWRMKHQQQQGFQALKEGQKVTAGRIRAHLMDASEHALKEELAQADKAQGGENRERLRDAAQRAREAREARIDELAASFAELESHIEATTVFKEMTRILTEEGVDAALAYAERQRPGVVERVRARKAVAQEQVRAELLPLLKAAGLHAVKGQVGPARAAYQQLLDLEPAWPEAMVSFACFLHDQSVQSQAHGSLSAAINDGRQALDLAQRLNVLNPANPQWQRVLAASLEQMANGLIVRRQDGDAALALTHYTRSLEVWERLLKANPDSALAAHDVAVSLSKLGDFLALRRGQPGDATLALTHYTRSLELAERLLKANPDSALAVRDVGANLDSLGDLLARRGQPGDAALALTHYTRSLEVWERLLKANPDSAEAVRDVALCLARLGDFMAQRGQPGDAALALAHYTRSLELAERLLKANPGSAQAVRDVSVSLQRLGDFLARRGLPGDPALAMTYYNRDLKACELLLKANPDSALAARDVSVSLERLGGVLAQRGLPGDAALALTHYIRSLEVAERLLKANPDSAQAARDVVVSHYKLVGLASKSGDAAAEEKHRRACYDCLHTRIVAGVTFDPLIMKLYQQLHETYGK